MSIVYERKNITGRVGSKDSPGYLMFAEKDVTNDEGNDIVEFSKDGSVTLTGLAPGVNPTDAAIVSQLGGSGISKISITLLSSGWLNNMQTVSIPGISSNEEDQAIWVIPSSDNETEYFNSIKSVSQGLNSLTFEAKSAPSEDLVVYVLISRLARPTDSTLGSDSFLKTNSKAIVG